jgi:hypothetical protein
MVECEVAESNISTLEQDLHKITAFSSIYIENLVMQSIYQFMNVPIRQSLITNSANQTPIYFSRFIKYNNTILDSCASIQ